MAGGRPVVGLPPADSGGGTGRAVVGLPPASSGGTPGRAVVGLPGAPTAAGSSGGGGILGALEGAGHFIASKAALAANDIKAIPGGVVQTIKDIPSPLTVAYHLATGNVGAAQKDVTPIAQDAKAQAQSASTALQHPLRDPFQTVTTVLPLLHAAGNVAARGAAVADAARAGGGMADVAKAAVAKPVVAPRLLNLGDNQVPLQPSKTVTGRAFQGVYDKVLQKAVDTNPDSPVASHATSRVGASLDETARYQQAMREAPAGALDQAAQKLTSKVSPAQGRVNQAALELTSVNTSPEDAAAYHLAQADKGVEPARNRVVAKLYQTVADKGLLTKNENGDMVVNAADHPQLAQADLALAKVQGRGDEILSRYGIRTPDQLQAAANAPGRYRAGATYEAPTPGKAGVSPALTRATAERDALAAIHEKALTQEAQWHAAQKTKDLGPLSEADAQARLAQLDAHHDALAEKIVPEISQYGGDISKREQLVRNKDNANARAVSKPTVKAEEFAAASDKLHEIASRGGNPTANALAELLNERARLRDALNARAEAALTGEQSPGLPRAPAPAHVSVPPASNPYRNRIVQIGTRLEAAQQKVERLAAAAEARTKPTGVVGGEVARPARGHVSYASSEKKLPQSPAAASPGPVVGEAKSPITSHANTGYNIEHGLVPKDVTGNASRHFRQILRFVNTTERRNAAIKFGTDVSRSKRDVLVKVPGEDHAKLSQAIEEALGKSKPTVDEVHGLNAALDQFRQEMVPGLADKFSTDAEHPVGTSAADAAAARGLDAPGGYKFVDRNLLGDLGRTRPVPGGKLAHGIDNINSDVTAATVYFKVGHAGTRVLTNAATNIIQGSAKPTDIAKSVRLWKQLPHEERIRALAAAGQHGFESMPHEGTSRQARFAAAGARWWAKHADAMFRFNSIAYEARKAGYDTPAKFKTLLNQLENPSGLSPDEAAKVDAVAKNANREGIAYDRLNNFERQYITRGIWFYPWVKGASVFAGRTLFEHPVKAGLLGAAGVQGRQQQQAQLGDLPSYEGGLFKVGGPDAAGNPLVADFSTFSPFATPADLLDIAAGKGKVAAQFNPALAGAGSLAYKLNPYGQPSKSPIADSLVATVAPAWPVQLAQAFLQRNQDQSKRMFPKSPGLFGTQDTLLRALLGPGTPRRINLAAAASAAAREKAGR